MAKILSQWFVNSLLAAGLALIFLLGRLTADSDDQLASCQGYCLAIEARGMVVHDECWCRTSSTATAPENWRWPIEEE